MRVVWAMVVMALGCKSAGKAESGASQTTSGKAASVSFALHEVDETSSPFGERRDLSKWPGVAIVGETAGPPGDALKAPPASAPDFALRQGQDGDLPGAGETMMKDFLAQVPTPADRMFAIQSMKAVVAGGKKMSAVRSFLLVRAPVVSNADIAKAEAFTPEGAKEDGLAIVLTPSGSEKFSGFTSRIIGRRLAIMMDGKVCIVPRVMNAITGGRIIVSQVDSCAGERTAKQIAEALTP